MQPYFFPYLGYFELINLVDKWIVFDTAQYIRHGWVNRNRILHPFKGWQYVIVPLKKHPREAPINEVEIADSDDWGGRILGQLQHYRRRAPYFSQTTKLVEECLTSEKRSLSCLNVNALTKVCKHLGIQWDFELSSKMQVEPSQAVEAGDWAVQFAKAFCAEEYINAPGGSYLFDSQKFSRSGIKLRLQTPFEYQYACPGYGFEPGLSVIDALMWNAPEAIKAHLDQRKERAVVY